MESTKSTRSPEMPQRASLAAFAREPIRATPEQRGLLLCPGFLLGVLSLLASGCQRSQPAAEVSQFDTRQDTLVTPAWFVDATAELGLEFHHNPGPTDGEYFLPQIMGSGAALLDYDNDGRLDIYLLQNGGPNSTARNQLFHQRADGCFENVSADSGLDVAGYGMGVAVGDINNDGLVDLYVSEYHGGRLFLNLGEGRFQPLDLKLGMDNPVWGMSCSFFDFDRDGWLDLFVTSYLNFTSRTCNNSSGRRDYCHPSSFPVTGSRLYRNKGCDSQGGWLGFEDRTTAAGMTLTGPGLGVLCADFNGDGWPDVFVANDAAANYLWINQRNGTFVDEAVARGVAFNSLGAAQGNMGVAFGDLAGNGLDDLLVTHLFSEYPGCWRQEARGSFREQASTAGLTNTRWRGTGFGTVLADFDNDGDLDWAVVNGRVARQGPPTENFWDAYSDRNQILANDGHGRFTDLSQDNPALCGKPNVARGLVMGDIDGDGGVDLLVTQIAGPARILRNVAPHRGHWLLVRTWDAALRRDAIGAEVTVVAGNRRWRRLNQPGQGYLASHDPRVHFGLGTVEQLDAIEVRWPDGTQERFTGSAVDRVLELRRGTGVPLPTREQTP